MTHSLTPSRRLVLIGGLAAGLSPTLPRPAHAVDQGTATALVQQVSADITRIINSGQSESRMIRDFENVLSRYADMPTIARSVLGPASRSASAGDLRGFQSAFQGYMARKYGRRFREFIGGSINVQRAQDSGRFVEVVTRVTLRGSGPLEVRFRVWDRSGAPRFIDLLIEGISLVITERNEIGALLDRNGGNIGAVSNAIRSLG